MKRRTATVTRVLVLMNEVSGACLGLWKGATQDIRDAPREIV